MDNITHSLVGAALAETGLKRWTPWATATLIIGANFPDIDVIVGVISPRTYLEHHRGITHAIVAIPFLAFLLAGIMLAGARWRMQKKPDLPRARFFPLFILSVLSISTHPLLDFTNSYGWRPFLPWNHQWFYGDVAFVVDPWLWAGLGGAIMLATAYSQRRVTMWGIFFAVLAVPVLLFEGAGIAIKIAWVLTLGIIFGLRSYLQLAPVTIEKFMRAVIVALLLYFGALTGLHQFALQQTQTAVSRVIKANEQILKVDAMPLPANPLHWKTVISTNEAFYFSDLFLFTNTPPEPRRYARQNGDAAAINAALREPELQAFMRFARFPVIETHPTPSQATQIEIRDARFFDLTNAVNSSFRTSILLDAQLRRIVE